MTPIPTATQRQIMQRLRTDIWRRLGRVSVTVGEAGLATLVRNGWIERRGEGPTTELNLTAAGLEALRAKIPHQLAGLKTKK